MAGLSHRSAIDRTPQHIPLTVGDFATVHRHRGAASRLARAWRRRGAIAVAVGGALAAAGVGLSLTRPVVAVYGLGSTVHVGDSVLTATGTNPDEFTGDAIMVLHRRPDGGFEASASTVSRGRHATAACRMDRPSNTGVQEVCEFHLDSSHITAVDQLVVRQGSVWRRRYEDGVEVSIAVPADGFIVPVPFAIGR